MPDSFAAAHGAGRSLPGDGGSVDCAAAVDAEVQRRFLRAGRGR
jgi:hypothetical protein